MPRAKVIASAKQSKRSPLPSANQRSCQPMIRPIANTISPSVVVHAKKETIGDWANQFSLAAYSTNGAHAPHATFGVPGGPQMPNRSATDERKPPAIESRSNHCALLSVLAPLIATPYFVCGCDLKMCDAAICNEAICR